MLRGNDNLPAKAQALLQHSGIVANAAANVTFAATPLKVNYLQGVIVSGGGAVAGLLTSLTVSGLLGGNMDIPLSIPAGVLLGFGPHIIKFPRPIPALDANTAISINLPALGTGNTSAQVSAFGFRL